MTFVAIIILLICVLFLTRGIFSPAKLSALMWIFLILGYLLFSSKPLQGGGMLWVAVAILALTLGERFGRKVKKTTSSSETITEYKVCISVKRAYRLLVIFILIAIAGKLAFLYKSGYDITVFFSINKFLAMNADLAYRRYNEIDATNNLITFMSAFSYLSPLCGGYLLLFARKNKRRIFLCLFSWFPVILSMLIDNTKSGILDVLILFICGLMVSYMVIHRRLPKLKIKNILLILLSIAIVFSLLFFAMCLRIGNFSSVTIDIVKEKFIIYAFGSVDAFDLWLTKYYVFDGYAFGVNTFMAPFNVLGIVVREQGVYDFIQDASSNVFTTFRGVILDFGMIGGLLFMFVVGLMGGRAYSKIKYTQGIVVQCLYIAVMFFLLRSYLISPWIYSSFWLVFIVFALFLVFVTSRKHCCSKISANSLTMIVIKG